MYVNTLPSAGAGTGIVVASAAGYHVGLPLIWTLTLASACVLILTLIAYRKLRGVA